MFLYHQKNAFDAVQILSKVEGKRAKRVQFFFFEKCIHQRLLLVLCYSSLRSKSDPNRNSETEKNYPTLNLTYFQLPSRIRTQAKSMEYEGEKKFAH